MTEETIKLRERLSSLALTAAEDLPQNDIKSISVKPQEDPDAPPALKLELFLEPSEQIEINNKLEQNNSAEQGSSRNSRANSEDNSYTILGFLESRIRNRIFSQDINQKVDPFATASL